MFVKWFHGKRSSNSVILSSIVIEKLIIQVGFAELKKTADNWANIGGTIIGVPIVGQ